MSITEKKKKETLTKENRVVFTHVVTICDCH